MTPILALIALVLVQADPAPGLDITTANDTADEIETAQQLHRLMETHAPWDFVWTRTVEIDRNAIPHSHPVLTLHTRYLENDTGLLATFLHEQLHWYVNTFPDARDAAMADFAEMYPDIPVGYPHGARDEESNALHLLVCLLELRALSRFVGEQAARAELESNTHYLDIYRAVLDDTDALQAVLDRHGIGLPEVSE